MRYFMELAYDGKNYFGWQLQIDQISVQEVITKKMKTLLKEDVTVFGVGRTDTGVHAKQFFAHFDVAAPLSEEDCKKLVVKLNAYLPEDIVIFNIFQVGSKANTRFDAISRTYKYYISQHKNPFNREFTYRVTHLLDIDAMNECCAKLLDYIDFTSFSKSNTQTATNICHIFAAKWYHENDMLVFEITADRFLRNMVRAIVGTMLDVGRKKATVSDFCAVIEAGNRCEAGMSVPGNALFLEKIVYDESIFTKK